MLIEALAQEALLKFIIWVRWHSTFLDSGSEFFSTL